jgi:CubicO group peptidase (beta-lactamase class C family)
MASRALPFSSAAPLPAIAPTEVGLSASRLERLHALIQGIIDRGEMAGALTLVARDGKIADLRTYGYRDLAARQPMQRDSLFRLASMTKMVTAVAVLTLYEEGRIGLDDPVAKYIPEFAHMRVGTGPDAAHSGLVEARPITIRHLLTHTSGLAAGGAAAVWLAPLYDRTVEGVNRASLKAYIADLAQLPLCNQPGDAMYYGLSYEVLGYLVEKVSGQPFEAYVRDRICLPLGMRDTFFQIPREKQSRLALTYQREPGPKLVLRPADGQAYYLGGPGYPRGGGGLVATADDFARFCQMLLNGGELEGVRILGMKTVELMTTDHLTDLKEKNTFLQPFESYGFGVSVRLTLALGPTPGSIGQFGWSGAYTTWCSVDPKEGTVVLLLAQHLPWNDDDLFTKVGTTFYQALTERRDG